MSSEPVSSRQRLGGQFLALRIAGDDVNFEYAHGCKITAVLW